MLQRPTPRLILASASASRRALLTGAGLAFEVRPADIDEAAVKRAARVTGLNGEDTALRLAGLKAAAVAYREPQALVIGADQILVCGDVWHDKPNDVEAAREQLRALRGRQHVLATAVVCHRGGGQVWHHVTSPRLAMRSFTEAFLTDYLASEGDAVTGTVGSYRLEGLGVHLFGAVEGDHSAILGLPLLPLLGFLREAGVLAA
ncbi:MAG TPA: nucleoside triphosphate pyrophosphatase [Acetobacteraceae bacterium]|jgi:septum formation protein|nr:nucleoside triphosphate pyrophosphatase [Acetobacteraceae bacterium]